MMPLQVAFDISELAAGHRFPRQRRGINRVVEEVCLALLRFAGDDRNALNLVLTSVANSTDATAYLAAQSQEAFTSATLLSQPAHLYWTALEQRSKAFVQETANRSIVQRILRWTVVRSLRRQHEITFRLPTFDPETMDIFHSPAMVPFPPYVLRARRPACFLTLYDLIPFRHPELDSGDALKSALTGFGPAHFAICISQYVKDDVCEHLHLDPSHVFVAPLAADTSRFHPCVDAGRMALVRRRYGLPEDSSPYLLSLCAVEPRKNLLHLIRCFARLRREDPTAREVRLVLVGYAAAANRQPVDSLLSEEKLENHVIITGYVEDDDLAPLYSDALAFVFPSLAEGFGLPPLEAMQCGVPVICSNRTSLPEVMGEAGLLIDPEDSDALCAAMQRVLHDEPLRAALSVRGLAQAARFSWDRCAADHSNAYRTALETKQG